VKDIPGKFIGRIIRRCSCRFTVGCGILRVSMLGFLKQLATFHVEGPTLADRTSALTRFGLFYFGRRWDVYARSLLSSAPF
jgi:hypothetical protein